jgi:hypothetical protein
MGNTTSNEEDNRIKSSHSKSRRSSHRSTRFNSISSNTSTHAGTWDQDILDSHKDKQHHGILNRLKNKTSARRLSSSISGSKNCPRLDIFSKHNHSSPDDLEQSASPSSVYSSPRSIPNDLYLADKYTDSQMTLLNNHHHINNNNQSLVGSTFYSNHSTTSIHSTASTVTTNDTNSNNYHRENSNISIPDHDQEIYKSYSSELMLKELYMLSETSPERRRDRDR